MVSRDIHANLEMRVEVDSTAQNRVDGVDQQALVLGVLVVQVCQVQRPQQVASDGGWRGNTCTCTSTHWQDFMSNASDNNWQDLENNVNWKEKRAG